MHICIYVEIHTLISAIKHILSLSTAGIGIVLVLVHCSWCFWKKQKWSEHGKSSWEKRKLDNIQLSSNTLWVTSPAETMNILSIRQLGNTTLLYFFKSYKLVGNNPSRGGHLAKYLYIYLSLEWHTLLVSMCIGSCSSTAHSLSLCSDNTSW